MEGWYRQFCLSIPSNDREFDGALHVFDENVVDKLHVWFPRKLTSCTLSNGELSACKWTCNNQYRVSFIIVLRSRLASLARALLFGEGRPEGGESFIDAWHGNSRFPPANRRQSATPRSRLRVLSSTRRRIPPVKITELGGFFHARGKKAHPRRAGPAGPQWPRNVRVRGRT